MSCSRKLVSSEVFARSLASFSRKLWKRLPEAQEASPGSSGSYFRSLGELLQKAREHFFQLIEKLPTEICELFNIGFETCLKCLSRNFPRSLGRFSLKFEKLVQEAWKAATCSLRSFFQNLEKLFQKFGRSLSKARKTSTGGSRSLRSFVQKLRKLLPEGQEASTRSSRRFLKQLERFLP